MIVFSEIYCVFWKQEKGNRLLDVAQTDIVFKAEGIKIRLCEKLCARKKNTKGNEQLT